jgi:5'-nucleotidase
MEVTMMTRVVRWSVCLLLVCGMPVLAAAGQVALTILHTNDTHGHLRPFSYPALAPAGSEIAALRVRQDIGGVARRAGLIRRLRAELEPRGTSVWVIDAGDFSDGTPFSTEYQGEADIAAMNAAGYTFATLGNHEFSVPFAKLTQLRSQFGYPVLLANVVEAATGKSWLEASTLRMLGPLTVGLFGLVTEDAGTYRAAREGGLRIAPVLETAQRLVAALRRQADIVMVISHAGEDVDEAIARGIPGIDVIVGGHTHSRLPVGAFVWRSDELKPKEVNGTIVVQAHQWGGELGRLDLLFDQDDEGRWRVARHRARLEAITADLPEDAAVAAVVARYWTPIAVRYEELIGHASGDFTDRGDDSAQYHLVADAVREAANTDVVLENVGGVRAPLLKGRVTRGDLVALDPFDNTVVTFSVTGKHLKTLLLTHQPAVSGLRYRIEDGALAHVAVAGQSVDDSRVYTVATNSFFARQMPGISVTDTGMRRLDALVEHVRRRGILRPAYDGRRVVFP